jgi:hypothetical protein
MEDMVPKEAGAPVSIAISAETGLLVALGLDTDMETKGISTSRNITIVLDLAIIISNSTNNIPGTPRPARHRPIFRLNTRPLRQI